MRFLVAIPVFNEEKHVRRVLERVREHARDVLVIDDGSTDGTACVLPEFPVGVIRHAKYRGFGRAMQLAFRWAAVDGFDWVITMDCDEQHEPAAIPRFVEAAERGTHDVISGSRYLKECACDDDPPPERRAINATLTEEINRRLGLGLTDAFCGFKAYRVSAVQRLRLTEDGYAFPMQFWVEASAARLRVREIPVRLIYNDPTRTFGGPLDHAPSRLKHYRDALHDALGRRLAELPGAATDGIGAAGVSGEMKEAPARAVAAGQRSRGAAACDR
jgi:dolichol-phosphate mannosyltransferase